mmetsp:Transcript_7752/g.8799  ORF Transcript_7752/g.8799 Transcript_7752/m.8799 type:complete len:347 (-) Transcript_7752:963-2003(-)
MDHAYMRNESFKSTESVCAEKAKRSNYVTTSKLHVSEFESSDSNHSWDNYMPLSIKDIDPETLNSIPDEVRMLLEADYSTRDGVRTNSNNVQSKQPHLEHHDSNLKSVVTLASSSKATESALGNDKANTDILENSDSNHSWENYMPSRFEDIDPNDLKNMPKEIQKLVEADYNYSSRGSGSRKSTSGNKRTVGIWPATLSQIDPAVAKELPRGMIEEVEKSLGEKIRLHRTCNMNELEVAAPIQKDKTIVAINPRENFASIRSAVCSWLDSVETDGFSTAHIEKLYEYMKQIVEFGELEKISFLLSLLRRRIIEYTAYAVLEKKVQGLIIDKYGGEVFVPGTYSSA